MNFCPAGGYTVGSERFLPDDPTDHAIPRLPLVGCSRLICRRCKAPLKHGAGLQLIGGHTFREIYDSAAQVSESPLVKPGLAKFRLYLCRCAAWGEDSMHRMNEPEPSLINDPDVVWRCSGHPIADLPHDFDGVRVTGEADLADLARRFCGGFIPDDAPADFKVGARWLARLHGRLAGTDLPDVLARAVADLLVDPTLAPLGRTLALQFFSLAPGPIGHRVVLDALNGDRKLFAGVPDELTEYKILGDSTLEDALWRAAGPMVGKLESARQLARDEVLAPGRARRSIYDALAIHDTDWLAEHAVDIVRANPTTADELLDSAMRNFPDDGPYDVMKAKVTAVLSQAKA